MCVQRTLSSPRKNGWMSAEGMSVGLKAQGWGHSQNKGLLLGDSQVCPCNLGNVPHTHTLTYALPQGGGYHKHM